jgi:hypothetical protein
MKPLAITLALAAVVLTSISPALANCRGRHFDCHRHQFHRHELRRHWR